MNVTFLSEVNSQRASIVISSLLEVMYYIAKEREGSQDANFLPSQNFRRTHEIQIFYLLFFRVNAVFLGRNKVEECLCATV